MKVTQLQNIFDVALQAYGTLNEVVRVANDNHLLLDETPPPGLDLIVFEGIGENRIKTFTIETEHSYNNEAIEATAVLLAADDIALSPKTEIVFIYK